MRTGHVTAGLAIVVVLTAAMTGCAGRSSSPPASAEPSPPITPRTARSVLAHYQRVNNSANASFNSGLEATVETAAQLTIDQTGYVIQKHQNQPYKPFTFRRPVFYIRRCRVRRGDGSPRTRSLVPARGKKTSSCCSFSKGRSGWCRAQQALSAGTTTKEAQMEILPKLSVKAPAETGSDLVTGEEYNTRPGTRAL